MGQTKRDRHERREQLAALAWSMAAQDLRLCEICRLLFRPADEVWRLLELHSRRRAARRRAKR